MAIRSISCFAGCGGLDVAVELAIAGVEPLVYLENEVATAEILVADRLRSVGNLVCPMQGAVMLAELIRRAQMRE